MHRKVLCRDLCRFCGTLCVCIRHIWRHITSGQLNILAMHYLVVVDIYLIEYQFSSLFRVINLLSTTNMKRCVKCLVSEWHRVRGQSVANMAASSSSAETADTRSRSLLFLYFSQPTCIYLSSLSIFFLTNSTLKIRIANTILLVPLPLVYENELFYFHFWGALRFSFCFHHRHAPIQLDMIRWHNPCSGIMPGNPAACASLTTDPTDRV